MRIELDGVEVLSKKYESFDELTNDFIDYEGQHGRRVPDYDLGIMLGAVGIYLLKKVIDELIQEARERRQEHQDDRRHAELLAKTDELIRAVQNAERARSQDATLGVNAASVSAFLQWARWEGVRIVVRLDTEAENDLKSTFVDLTTDVPDSEVNGPKSELEGEDST